MKTNLYLVYVEKLNDIPNSQGLYEYEFFFSETPEIVWGADWNQFCPSSCSPENMRPESSMYHEVKKLYSIYPIMTIEENSCLSCQDMVDGIIACAWEDISDYEEYPDPIRLVFRFGEELSSVEDKLAQRHQFFYENNKKENNEEEWMSN